MNITPAGLGEFRLVREFYDSIIDAMEDAPYHPAWKKGVYPSNEELAAAIRKEQLYLLTLDWSTLGAMIVNQQHNEGYRQIVWPSGADPDEALVIHALGVHPAYQRHGCGKSMVEWVINHARLNGYKVVRLDVLKGNLPAERLYESLGFQKAADIPMYYPDTGWTNFLLYEYQV